MALKGSAFDPAVVGAFEGVLVKTGILSALEKAS
jgi:hypothetical protein